MKTCIQNLVGSDKCFNWRLHFSMRVRRIGREMPGFFPSLCWGIAPGPSHSATRKFSGQHLSGRKDLSLRLVPTVSLWVSLSRGSKD